MRYFNSYMNIRNYMIIGIYSDICNIDNLDYSLFRMKTLHSYLNKLFSLVNGQK